MFRRKNARTKTKPLTTGPTVLSDRDLAGVVGGWTKVEPLPGTSHTMTMPSDPDGVVRVDDA